MKKRKISKVYKLLGLSITASALLFGDQIRRIRNRLAASTSTDVLSVNRLKPDYVYIDDPFIQEQLKEGKRLQDESVKVLNLQRWFIDKIKQTWFVRNCLSYQNNIAWRYLNLTTSDDWRFRLRAVLALSRLDQLTDIDYQQLAQCCDLRTAISLARIENIDLRFFLDAPYFKTKPDFKALVKCLHDFLIALDVEAKHTCLQYFISRYFDSAENELKSFDDDLVYKNSHLLEIVPLCIDALLHHSWIGNNAKDMVTYGGLPLLMEVYKYLIFYDPDNTEALVNLVSLMSSISVHKECAMDFFKSGWIKILATWNKNKNIKISVPAARTLLNFDSDNEPPYKNDVKFQRRIYPLHPLTKSEALPMVDVVLIHGLLGGAFITWRQRDSQLSNHKSALDLLDQPPSIPKTGIKLKYAKQETKNNDGVDIDELIEDEFEFVLDDIPVDGNKVAEGMYSIPGNECKDFNAKCVKTDYSSCWPKDWLSIDCPNVRILAVDYETNLTMWSSICPSLAGQKRTFAERSSQMLNGLVNAGVGSRPIIWLAHSMGGLLVKNMLVQALSSQDVNKQKVLENSKGIVFFSTPHRGSHMAALNTTTKMLVYPSTEVQELRENCPSLLKLHSNFLDMLEDHPMKIISFAERESTYITALKFELKFVKDESSDIEVGELYGIPLDHLCICKPACRESFIYQKILRLISDVIHDVDRQKRSTKVI